MQPTLSLFIHQNSVLLLTCITILVKQIIIFHIQIWKEQIFSKFRICVGKFQIEEGHQMPLFIANKTSDKTR
jgi:hypothetical protein